MHYFYHFQPPLSHSNPHLSPFHNRYLHLYCCDFMFQFFNSCMKCLLLWLGIFCLSALEWRERTHCILQLRNVRILRLPFNRLKTLQFPLRTIKPRPKAHLKVVLQSGIENTTHGVKWKMRRNRDLFNKQLSSKRRQTLYRTNRSQKKGSIIWYTGLSVWRAPRYTMKGMNP